LPLPERAGALALAGEAASNEAAALPVTWLLEVELANAIEQSVFVSRTTGQFRLTPETAAVAHALFAG
jgi:hypothetical protein